MTGLTRLLSRPVNKPYRTRDLDHTEPPFLDDAGFLAFKPDDIENPQNWSTPRRIAVTISAVMLVMNATFASSAPSGCIPSIAKDFGISTEAAALTVTLFLLGYCAGPLLFAPLSELYGRRWIFYISFTMYIAFNFLCAFAPNFGSLLVGRFLTGTLVSAPLSNAPGVLADIWSPLERANAMALFSTMVWIGPALGPVVAGFLELKKDWHWAFYVLIWLGAGTWLIMLTIPETHAPTILLHKAKRVRKAKIPGYENVKAPAEKQDRSITSVFGVALTRPWVILFDPISLLCAIYLAVIYTLLYMLFSIYPIVFQERRGWNSGVGELPLIGTVVGAILGGSIVLYDTRRRTKKIERGEIKADDMEPEDRLPLAMVGGIGFAAAMFWFSWTAEFKYVFLQPACFHSDQRLTAISAPYTGLCRPLRAACSPPLCCSSSSHTSTTSSTCTSCTPRPPSPPTQLPGRPRGPPLPFIRRRCFMRSVLVAAAVLWPALRLFSPLSRSSSTSTASRFAFGASLRRPTPRKRIASRTKRLIRRILLSRARQRLIALRT